MASAPGPRPAEAAPRPLPDVAAALGLPAPPGADAVAVTGVTLDSRDVVPGDLYAALPGAVRHGADFAAAAVRQGAVAVLTDPAGRARLGPDRFNADLAVPVLVVDDPRARLGELAAWVYGHPSRHLRLVGVTGTNGKTTVSHLVAAGLRAAGHRTGLVGTVSTRIADEELPSVRTTPEAPALQALLAVMRERGVAAVAMEVSSHALAQGRVDGLRYDVAVFTNLSQDHLDFHGSMREYFAVKAALFTPQRSRRGVVDVDDPWGRELVARATVPVTTVSPTGAVPADWRGSEVDVRPDGSALRLRGPAGEDLRVRVRLPGRFNVDNAALAVVALLEVGVPAQVAVSGVASCAGVPGRMQRLAGAGGVSAVVDYAHTPDAVERVLAALRPAVAGRLVVVLGCGGDRDRAKRPLIGEVAAREADLLVVTDDNPRSEDPAEIRAAVLAGAARVPEGVRAAVLEVPDRRAAIVAAVERAGAGDLVAVLGKGHERGQEVAGTVHPFDDLEVLRELLVGVPA